MLLKELIKLNESATVIELPTFKGKRIPHSAWTEGVLYKGHNVYKLVYENEPAELKRAERDIEQDFSIHGSIHMQETYLGFSPKEDLFLMGFDGWTSPDDDDEDGEDGNCSPFIKFTISADGKIKVVTLDTDLGGNEQMWYDKRGGLMAAHEKYPDLIDIRLD